MDTQSYPQVDRLDDFETPERDPGGSLSELIKGLSAFLGRQYPIFVIVTGCTLGLAVVYLMTTSPLYTAHALLMIDTSKPRVLLPQQAALNVAPLDVEQIETQAQILRSDDLALTVLSTINWRRDTRRPAMPACGCSSG